MWISNCTATDLRRFVAAHLKTAKIYRRTQGTLKTEAMIAACCAVADSTQGPHICYALSWQTII